MADTMRPINAWAVSYGKGYIDSHSVRPLRKQAVAAFTSDPAGPRWDYWHKIGCRAIKVRILPASNGQRVQEGEDG